MSDRKDLLLAHPNQSNPTNPVVFFDITIGGHNAGRVVMEVRRLCLQRTNGWRYTVKHAYSHTHVHTHTHTHTHIHTHNAHTHTYTPHAHTHTHTYTYIHTQRTHTHIHTAHTHTYTHAHAVRCWWNVSDVHTNAHLDMTSVVCHSLCSCLPTLFPRLQKTFGK